MQTLFVLKRITSRTVPFFLGLLLSSCGNSQSQINLSFESDGQIKYSDYYNKIVITYDSCSSLQTYQTWNFKNGYLITEVFNPVDSITSVSLPIKLFRNSNSIYLTYINDQENKIDTVEQFRLSKKDTINSFGNFRLSTDNVNWDKLESIYIGDTVLKIKNSSYDCYRFEVFSNWIKSFPGPSRQKILVYIDKKSLIPIQEDHFSFYVSHFCIPKKVWFLWRQVKLIN